VTVVDKTLFQVFELNIVFRYGIDTSCNCIKVFIDVSAYENCFRSTHFCCWLPLRDAQGRPKSQSDVFCSKIFMISEKQEVTFIMMLPVCSLINMGG
jgi:hypothetical protein